MAIRQSMADMNSIMCSMLSPSGKTISASELISEFGCPNVNISDIDLEWM